VAARAPDDAGVVGRAHRGGRVGLPVRSCAARAVGGSGDARLLHEPQRPAGPAAPHRGPGPRGPADGGEPVLPGHPHPAQLGVRCGQGGGSGGVGRPMFATACARAWCRARATARSRSWWPRWRAPRDGEGWHGANEREARLR
jgi:hypothetical protein